MRIRGFLLLALALTLCAAVAARAGEEVPLDKLPKKVVDALKTKFPTAKLVSAAKDADDDGKTVFEVEIAIKEEEINVTLTPEGKIVQVEREIALKDLPKPVVAAVQKKYPKATLKEASVVTKDDKAASYGVTLVTAGKKTLEVYFDPAGKFLSEDEKKEDDK